MSKLARLIFTLSISIFTLLVGVVSSSHAGIVNYTNGNSILYLSVHDNILWAGTNGGVIKWDLKNLSYDKIGTDGRLPHMKVTAIAFDKKGNTWLGTHMGVVRYDKKKWQFYGVKNGLPSPWINHIYVDHNDDTPWVSTRNGIARFNGYYWEKEKNATVKMELMYSMTQDVDKNYWYASKGDGIIHFDGITWKSYKSVNGIPSGFLRSVTSGRDGMIWFGTYRGVISFDGRSWKRYQIKDGLPSTQVNYVFVDSKNRLWAATAKGACFLKDGKWQILNSKDGLIDDYTMAVAEDKEGNIYIGTKKGISRYDGKSISDVFIKDDLHGYKITAAALDHKNTLWFSSGDEASVESFDGKAWKYYSPKDGLGNTSLNCISVENDGSVWFGGYEGVSVYRKGKWSKLQDDKNLLSNVNAIAHDKDGSIWFATGEGLVHLKNDIWETFDTKEGLPHKTVFSIFPEKNYLWIGTYKGAMKVSRNWTEKSFPDTLKDLHVSDIEKDLEGNLWFATMNGAYRFNGKDWKRFGFYDGLADNRVYCITVGKNGYLWFGTFGGITRYDGESFKSYSKGFGLADEVVHDVVIDQHNRKWIATAQGISCLDDRLEFDNMAYSGLGAKGSLTIADPSLNKNKETIDSVQVTIQNLLLEKKFIFPFMETGKNTGTFSLATSDETFGFISSISKRKDNEAIVVMQGHTNFLIASYMIPETGEKVIAKAFWEDVVDKGNLDGNAVVDRFDAAIARKIRKGFIKDYPMYPGVDVNGDGKIGMEEEEYALKVNSGEINPFTVDNNEGKKSSAKVDVEAFRPQNLPWDVWKIKAKEGGMIKLDKLTLEIPPDALSKDTAIEVYQGERTPSPNGLELLPVGKGYNLNPLNLSFDKPVKIKIKYTEDDLKAWGIKDESSLRLGMWNRNSYQVISSAVDIEKKQVEGAIDFFPDLLNRPNRPPYAPMRTSPISNILTHSNYFTVVSIKGDKNQELESAHNLSSIALTPTIQVIPIPETKQYHAIGIDRDGNRLKDFRATLSVIEEDGKGTIDQNGNFETVKDGIIFIKAHQGNTSKKMITFLGTCTWCHYFGAR